MADDVTLPSGGGGAVMATDEDSGANRHYQIVKLADGTADSETRIASGNGTSTNAMRVTLSSDSTGVVSIDDNDGSITVDNADITTVAGAVSGTEMQVDIVSGNVTNAGTFVVQEDGDALTALQLLDDIVYTDDTSTHATGTSKGALLMAAATPTDTLVSANDIGALAMSTDRRLLVNSQFSAQTIDVSIDDGGNSITVDGTVTANLSATDNAVLDTIDTALDAINAKLVTGTVIGDVNLGATDNAVLDSIASSVHAEDAAHGSGDAGIMSLAVRKDGGGSLVGTDGDYSPLQVDAAGYLAVSAASVASHDVTNTGAFSVQEDGDALTALNTIATAIHTDDSAFSLGVDEGVMMMAYAGTQSVNANDAAALACEIDGALHIHDGGNAITVDNAGTFAVQSGGTVAHDGVDSGNPVKIGGKAYSFDGTPPQTAVAEADRVNAIFTPQGRQYVETSHPNYWRASVDYATAQTNATIKTAPGASLKLYITDVIVSNGAVAGNITILDGSGGAVLLELYPAINGGLTHSFRTPIALTANTLLAITSTTVTTHSVTVTGFIAA